MRFRSYDISANYELDSLDVTLYESKYNPKDYLIEGSNDLQRKYYIDSINDTLMWENQKVLMENKNLVIENSLPNKAEAGKLGKILNESYVLNTKGIMLKKDKIYAFLFSINDNYNGNYIYYIKKYENYHYKRIKKVKENDKQNKQQSSLSVLTKYVTSMKK